MPFRFVLLLSLSWKCMHTHTRNTPESPSTSTRIFSAFFRPSDIRERQNGHSVSWRQPLAIDLYPPEVRPLLCSGDMCFFFFLPVGKKSVLTGQSACEACRFLKFSFLVFHRTEIHTYFLPSKSHLRSKVF